MTNVDVLIVEDDDNLREALTDTLLFAGYSVVAAENGQAALARFSEQTFRMLVTDVQMQHNDGMALLSAVRKQNQKTTVVVMSAQRPLGKACDSVRLGGSG